MTITLGKICQDASPRWGAIVIDIVSFTTTRVEINNKIKAEFRADPFVLKKNHQPKVHQKWGMVAYRSLLSTGL